MKTKFFTLFAAFALLFGAKAMAQTNGDVNGDGKTDEQDITAIIQIMQEAGGVAEPTKYYWYAGIEMPVSLDSDPTPNDILNDKGGFNANEWHTLASDATLINQGILGGDGNNYWIVAVPKSFGFKPVATDMQTPLVWPTLGSITINGIEYELLRSTSKSKRTTIMLAVLQ